MGISELSLQSSTGTVAYSGQASLFCFFWLAAAALACAHAT